MILLTVLQKKCFLYFILDLCMQQNRKLAKINRYGFWPTTEIPFPGNLHDSYLTFFRFSYHANALLSFFFRNFWTSNFVLHLSYLRPIYFHPQFSVVGIFKTWAISKILNVGWANILAGRIHWMTSTISVETIWLTLSPKKSADPPIMLLYCGKMSFFQKVDF